MKKFEVGKRYEFYQRDFGSFKVIRRTPKTITAANDYTTWRMRIKIDTDGDEYVVDTCVGKKWRDAFTCSARWELA